MNTKTIKIKDNINLIGTLAFAAICLTSIINIQIAKVNKPEIKLNREEYLKQEKLEKANLAIFKKIPTLGFDNLKANLAYLRFLQYFGDSEARENIGYSLSPEYFEILVDNDPRFVRPYFLMSPATSIFAGKPEKSVSFISKGLSKITPETHPQSYYLWLYKATDEMLFLGDMEAAKQSYQMAVKWAEKIETPAAQKSANNIRQTAKFIAEDPDSTIAQIGAWTMVLSSTSDEKTIQRSIQQIEALGGQVIAQADGSIRVKVPEN